MKLTMPSSLMRWGSRWVDALKEPAENAAAGVKAETQEPVFQDGFEVAVNELEQADAGGDKAGCFEELEESNEAKDEGAVPGFAMTAWGGER